VESTVETVKTVCISDRESTFSYTFPSTERLKRSRDITRVFKKGKTASIYGLKLFYLQNPAVKRRIAFTFEKKFGNAVMRNRAKRLAKESYRHLRPSFGIKPGFEKLGFDAVLMIFKPDREKANAEVVFENKLRNIRVLFEKAGLV
jgi:ribonuclease P protein component